MLHPSWKEIHVRAKKFVAEHVGDASEAGQKQTFRNKFFDVFGLRRASFASFEENARNVRGERACTDFTCPEQRHSTVNGGLFRSGRTFP